MSQQTTSQDFYNEVNLECTQVSVKGKFKVLQQQQQQQLPLKGTRIKATINRVQIDCVSKEDSSLGREEEYEQISSQCNNVAKSAVNQIQNKVQQKNENPPPKIAIESVKQGQIMFKDLAALLNKANGKKEDKQKKIANSSNGDEDVVNFEEEDEEIAAKN